VISVTSVAKDVNYNMLSLVNTKDPIIMRSRTMKRIIFLLLLLTVMIMSGAFVAAQTVLTDVWKDKGQVGPAQKVSVLWLARAEQNRLLAENEFVRQLKMRGLAAMPGYVVIPPDRQVEKEEVLAKFRELGVDAVVILRVINKQAAQTPIPSAGPIGPAHLTGFYQFVYDAPVPDETGPVYLETNVFDVRTGKRAWAARSVTKVDVVDQKAVSDFVTLMIERMAADKLIP
jgi:hypothetical protein